MTSPDHGSREVTREDRAIAVRRMLMDSTSPLRVTDGMRRAPRENQPTKRDPRLWWVRVLYARKPGKRDHEPHAT